MIFRSVWAAMMIAGFLASASMARGQDATSNLSNLTVQKIKDAIDKVLGDAAKATFNTKYSFVPDTTNITYTPGTPPVFTWGYPKAAGLMPDQVKGLTKDVKETLIPTLNQQRVLSEADTKTLGEQLQFQEIAPPPAPVLSKPDNITLKAGESKTVSFTLSNVDPAGPKPNLTATSSSLDIVPTPAPFGGSVPNLTLNVLAGTKTGTSTITVTAKGSGEPDWSVSTTFNVTVNGLPIPPKTALASPQTGWPVYPSPQWVSAVATPDVICQAVTARASVALPAAAQAPASTVIPRGRIVKGQADGDWEPVFHKGLQAFRAGNHDQAVEYFAASADLGDDPRAWDFLGLASIMTGDTRTARGAAHYSAARVHIKPNMARGVSMALMNMEGPARDRLVGYKAEIDVARSARAILAARPNLRGGESTDPRDRGIVLTAER